MRALAAVLLCMLALCAGGSRAQEAHDAEKRLRSVRGELREVTAQRRQLESQRGDASRQLREADTQVSRRQHALRQTRVQLQRDTEQLATLQAEQARHAGDLQLRRAELARLLRAVQVGGEAPALQALLAQERVAEAGRSLILQGYLQRAQVARIQGLNAEITRLQALEDAIVQRRAALESTRQLQAKQVAELQQARQQRAGMLAGLDRQYQDRAQREKVLGRDAKALQSVLAKLRATAARAEHEAAQARAEAARQAKATGKPVQRRPQVASMPALRVGGLGWPVAGSLLASYGGKLPDGRRSEGVLIAAPAGTAVKAVADGTVVFADWMTGYGNILIVDHGNGYMSLYAHNDSLQCAAGDQVKRAETLATVGSSGGQETPALYFELRRNGAPVNPTGWLTRQ